MAGLRERVCPQHRGERDTGGPQGWGGRQGRNSKSLVDLDKDLRF